MFELALRENEGPVFLKDIARHQNISLKYLSKLVIPLRGAKLVRSVRGMRGGYMLARDPSAITTKEIVETLEGEIASGGCGKDGRECTSISDCPTRMFWCRLDDGISKILTENTLKTLVDEYVESRKNEAITFDI